MVRLMSFHVMSAFGMNHIKTLMTFTITHFEKATSQNCHSDFVQIWRERIGDNKMRNSSKSWQIG